jgi:hypothetical protein
VFRRSGLCLTIASAAIFAQISAGPLASASTTGPQSCQLDPRDNVVIHVRTGHAYSGTWSLAPVLRCNNPEVKLSFSVVLRHDGRDVPALSSSGSCADLTPPCRQASGPTRRESYGRNVRGTWIAHAIMTFTGADAIFFANCRYDATALTSTCVIDSAPTSIR